MPVSRCIVPKHCVVCAVALALSALLQGCGKAASPTPAPAPTPPTPAPPPTPPTPSPPTPAPTPAPTPKPTEPPPPCADAACCKSKVTGGLKLAQDGQLCEDFYKMDTGIAVSMVSLNVWAGTGSGSTGMDSAVFNLKAPPKVIAGAEQAISITHSGKAAWMYPAASQYGVAYGLGPSSVFWQFFTTCPSLGGVLCGQCTDGFLCAVKSDKIHARQTLNNMTFADFTQQKNAIVANTGTMACKNHDKTGRAYNEFDSNGLSRQDLLGVFVAKTGGAASRQPAPPAADVCKFLATANPERKEPWPVFSYYAMEASSSLILERYLDCSGHESASQVLV